MASMGRMRRLEGLLLRVSLLLLLKVVVGEEMLVCLGVRLLCAF
jgi:hypothetical protein